MNRVRLICLRTKLIKKLLRLREHIFPFQSWSSSGWLYSHSRDSFSTRLHLRSHQVQTWLSSHYWPVLCSLRRWGMQFVSRPLPLNREWCSCWITIDCGWCRPYGTTKSCGHFGWIEACCCTSTFQSLRKSQHQPSSCCYWGFCWSLPHHTSWWTCYYPPGSHDRTSGTNCSVIPLHRENNCSWSKTITLSILLKLAYHLSGIRLPLDWHHLWLIRCWLWQLVLFSARSHPLKWSRIASRSLSMANFCMILLLAFSNVFKINIF